jgi:glycosyltransferase involved in cell wall biosynthesis
VTVVIPVRDGAGHVGRAIESVLAQSVAADAVLVVDDGSTDDTVAVVTRFGDRVAGVSTPPRGAAAARNRGVRDATTDAIAFLDADDTWPVDRLERHLAVLAARHDVDVVLGATRYLDLPPEELARYRFPNDETTAVVMHLGAATVRRSVFDAHGMLDESLRCYEDWDWFLKLREAGVALHVDGAIANEYRRRPGSTSQLSRPGDPTLPALLKRSLDRRRAHGAAAGAIAPLPLDPGVAPRVQP